MSKIERVAEAMRARRAELINQPLNRVWDELARVAIDTMENPWIDWDWSSDMPVPEGTRVDVMHRDGTANFNQTAWYSEGLTYDSPGADYAGAAYWCNDGMSADIVRYRVAS